MPSLRDCKLLSTAEHFSKPGVLPGTRSIQDSTPAATALPPAPVAPRCQAPACQPRSLVSPALSSTRLESPAGPCPPPPTRLPSCLLLLGLPPLISFALVLSGALSLGSIPAAVSAQLCEPNQNAVESLHSAAGPLVWPLWVSTRKEESAGHGDLLGA